LIKTDFFIFKYINNLRSQQVEVDVIGLEDAVNAGKDNSNCNLIIVGPKPPHSHCLIIFVYIHKYMFIEG